MQCFVFFRAECVTDRIQENWVYLGGAWGLRRIRRHSLTDMCDATGVDVAIRLNFQRLTRLRVARVPRRLQVESCDFHYTAQHGTFRRGGSDNFIYTSSFFYLLA